MPKIMQGVGITVRGEKKQKLGRIRPKFHWPETYQVRNREIKVE